MITVFFFNPKVIESWTPGNHGGNIIESPHPGFTLFNNFLGTPIYQMVSDGDIIGVCYGILMDYQLQLFNIAMENGPLIEDKHDDLPIQNGSFA